MAATPDTTPHSTTSVGIPIPKFCTPHKHIGQYYNHEQYSTPNSRPKPAYQSPFLLTPSSKGSQGRRVASQHCAGVSPSLCPATTGGVYNPFDGALLETLGQPIFSPNVFASKGTPIKSPAGFRWSIEHIAVLHPAEIDDFPVHQAEANKLDKDIEEKAQQAINTYFSSHQIVPSPWTDSAKKKPFRLPMTPCTPASCPSLYSQGSAATPSTKPETKKVNCKMQDANVQTTLSLPVNFDLRQLLGEYYTQQTGEEPSPDLSASSLRRKLFFHGENNAPPSPVQCETSMMRHSLPMDFDVSPRVSPVKCPTPHGTHHTHLDTPGSNQFSSSPIRSSMVMTPSTPCLRRCSTAPDLMASPELSPIASSASKHRLSAHMSNGSTPLCAPLQATPSSGVPSNPMISPGISPICGDNSSYKAKNKSNRSISLRREGLQPVPTPRELQPQLFPDEEEEEASELRMTDLKSPTVSEMEQGTYPVAPAGSDVIATGNLQQFRIPPDEETMDGMMDSMATQDLISQTGALSNQDTGYHTNSLQLTHQETTGLHTNLTSQFGSLPLSNQDTGIEDNDLDQDQSGGSKHANSWPSHHKPSADTHSNSVPSTFDLEESEVVIRAREVLARINGQAIPSRPEIYRTDLNVNHHQSQPVVSSSKPTLTIPTPHRERYKELGVLKDTESAKQIKPSELASHLLSRAGKDFERYCSSSGNHENIIPRGCQGTIIKKEKFQQSLYFQ